MQQGAGSAPPCAAQRARRQLLMGAHPSQAHQMVRGSNELVCVHVVDEANPTGRGLGGLHHRRGSSNLSSELAKSEGTGLLARGCIY